MATLTTRTAHSTISGHTKYRKVAQGMHNVPQGQLKVPQGRFKVGKRLKELHFMKIKVGKNPGFISIAQPKKNANTTYTNFISSRKGFTTSNI